MTVRALFRIVHFIVALPLAGTIAFVQPFSARAADHNAPIANADMKSASSKDVDTQIARIQNKLHITAGQMPQWHALAAVMRDNAERIQLSHADRAKIHPTTVIDELYADRRETQARLQRLERVIPVAEAMFAVLSKDQKREADALFGGLRRGPVTLLDIRN